MPRQFSTAGWEVIGSSCLVEEEESEWYKPEDFYPVRIGEVFKSQYQVVGKLGYGTFGTAWLCRDLLCVCNLHCQPLHYTYHTASNHKYVTLKIGTLEALQGEVGALRHLKTIKTDHPGSLLIRQMLDEFQINNKNGIFHCLVHPPLAISVKAFRSLLPERALPVILVQLIVKQLLIGLDFLHTEAKVIHTGTSNGIQ
jgi:serine/threonine protein kinase